MAIICVYVISCLGRFIKQLEVSELNKEELKRPVQCLHYAKRRPHGKDQS